MCVVMDGMERVIEHSGMRGWNEPRVWRRARGVWMHDKLGIDGVSIYSIRFLFVEFCLIP